MLKFFTMLFACAAFTACFDFDSLADGGAGGGDEPADGGDGGAGGEAGGGSGGGVGGSGGSGGGSTAWVQMAINNVVSESPVRSLTGEADNVWALLENGRLFHSTGGAFNPAGYFNGAQAVYATGDMVVVLRNNELQSCTGDCADGGVWTSVSLGSSIGWALCGSGAEYIIAVVSDAANVGQLVEWNGAEWKTGAVIDRKYPRHCWLGDEGALYISGSGGVTHVANNGTFSQISLRGEFNITWGGATLGGTTWVVGAGNLVARGAGASVEEVLTDSTTGVLRAVAGFDEDEVYLMGTFTSTNGVGPGYVWNGQELKKLGTGAPFNNFEARAALRTGPGEIFVGGVVSGGSRPIIYRKRR